MKTKTSASDPLYVSWIDYSRPGKVGLTMAPGKRGHGGLVGATWRRDLRADINTLASVHKTGLLLCLLEPHEFQLLDIPMLFAEASSRMLFHWLPIRDGGVPDTQGIVRQATTWIEKAARSGENVVIHCRGGLGRSGLVGGCYLKSIGFNDREVFEALRMRHPTLCPETNAQRAFISSFGSVR